MLLPITSPPTTALPRPPVPLLCPLLQSLASSLKLLIEVDLDYDLGCDMGQVRYISTECEKKVGEPHPKAPRCATVEQDPGGMEWERRVSLFLS